MATTKTTTRPKATTKRATSTNGKSTKKAAKPRPKKLEEMTVEELGQLAWETTYKNRHKRLDQ